MSTTEINERVEQPISVRVSEIVDDLQRLVEQQFKLMQREVEEELWRRAVAAAMLGAGALTLMISILLFCFGLVHLVHWLALPAGSDPATVPLWGCYGIVTGVLAVAGGILGKAGWSRISSMRPGAQQ